MNCRIHDQYKKSVVFLYIRQSTNWEWNQERYYIHNNKIYKEINLTKEIPRFINWKLQMMPREIKEDLNKWRDSPCSWNRR